MPKARARIATSWPIRPKPSTPSVLPSTSVPPNLLTLPLAAREAGVRLRDVAGEREHQRDRVLGGGDRVGLRRVGDDDPALGGGGDVDVVDAHAGTADHPQVVGALDHLGVELRRAADQDAVVVADALQQLARGSSRCRGRRRSARAACRRRCRRSSPRRGRGTARSAGSCGRRNAGLDEDALGRADAGAVLDLVAELGERDLEAAERRSGCRTRRSSRSGAIRRILPLRWSWPPLAVMPSLRRAPGTLLPSIVLGQLERGDDRGLRSSGLP